MVANIRRIVLGDSLSEASRDQLVSWLEANKTGRARLRAGLPQGWRVGDKTGTGSNGATADIGVIWPVERPPIVAAVYFTEAAPSETARNAIIADVGRIIAGNL
jgi:beta-lactamase class A